MKVQCEVCGSAPAALLCPADEAALCRECDANVHAANKLASKHERLPLHGHEPPSTCDICQDKPGYIFCLDDRAVLCRECDLLIHSSNNPASKHKRFFLPTITVGLMPLHKHSLSSNIASTTPSLSPKPNTTPTPSPYAPSSQKNEQSDATTDHSIGPPQKEPCRNDFSPDTLVVSKYQSQPNMPSCHNSLTSRVYTPTLTPSSQHRSHDNSLSSVYDLSPRPLPPSSIQATEYQNQTDSLLSNSNNKNPNSPVVETSLPDPLIRLRSFFNLPEIPLTSFTEVLLAKMDDYGINRNELHSGLPFDSSTPVNFTSIPSEKVTSPVRLKRQQYTPDIATEISETFHQDLKKRKASLEV